MTEVSSLRIKGRTRGKNPMYEMLLGVISVLEVGKHSNKGQVTNILSFVGHMVCHIDLTLSLQHKSRQRQYVKKWVWLCPNKTLCTIIGCWSIWPTGWSLLISSSKRFQNSLNGSSLSTRGNVKIKEIVVSFLLGISAWIFICEPGTNIFLTSLTTDVTAFVRNPPLTLQHWL